MSDDRQLGFAGMVMVGIHPAQAWASICDDMDADVQALVDMLSPAALDKSRADWAAYGLPPPWDAGCKLAADCPNGPGPHRFAPDQPDGLPCCRQPWEAR